MAKICKISSKSDTTVKSWFTPKSGVRSRFYCTHLKGELLFYLDYANCNETIEVSKNNIPNKPVQESKFIKKFFDMYTIKEV